MQAPRAALRLSWFCPPPDCAALRLQAVADGSWLLVEGIDSAPPEVLAVLSPLLEGRSLHLSHRAQVITAGPGFQFLATVTSAPGDHDHSPGRWRQTCGQHLMWIPHPTVVDSLHPALAELP